MSLVDRMIYEMQMVTPILLANIHFDAGGAYSHHFEPGDPEFVNPFAAPGYSYRQATQDQLDQLDFAKSWITQEQYDRQTDFLEPFSGAARRKRIAIGKENTRQDFCLLREKNTSECF